MKSIAILSLASSALAAVGSLEFAIHKQVRPQLSSRISRRDAFDTSVFTDDGSAYYLNISVGTPGQVQTIELDTGSSDLFVTDSTAPFCRNNTCAGGTFDASKSSTFQVVAPAAFNISFVDGSTDSGDLISDVVQIRDLVITNVTLGLAHNVNPNTGIQTGLLGLGYSVNEGGALNNGIQYPNFIETLVTTGQIASRLYSIFLSNIGQYGSIVFGGVDTQKFKGNLVTLNCFPSGGKNVRDFNLYMPNVTIVDANGTVTQIVGKNNTQYGFFDSGTSAWYVGEAVFNRIVDLAGFVYSPDLGLAIRTCADISNTTAFNFQFGGWRGGNSTRAPLRVLLSQMVAPLVLVTGVPYTDSSGKQHCALEVFPAKSDFNGVWGDSIMRAGYFVYDLDNGQVSIGQARYSDQSNIVAVQAGPHGLANAINQPQYAQTAQTYPPAPFATAFSREASVYTTNNTIGVATVSTAIGSGSLRSSLPAYTNSTSRATYTSVSSNGSSTLDYSDRSVTPSNTSSGTSTSESISTTDSWYSSATSDVDEVSFLKARVAELQAKLDSCGCHY
ncbi:acid protease, partial [Aureobasidium melanogenum]